MYYSLNILCIFLNLIKYWCDSSPENGLKATVKRSKRNNKKKRIETLQTLRGLASSLPKRPKLHSTFLCPLYLPSFSLILNLSEFHSPKFRLTLFVHLISHSPHDQAQEGSQHGLCYIASSTCQPHRLCFFMLQVRKQV